MNLATYRVTVNAGSAEQVSWPVSARGRRGKRSRSSPGSLSGCVFECSSVGQHQTMENLDSGRILGLAEHGQES